MDDVGNRNSHRYRYNAGGGPTAYDMTYDQANRMTAIDSQPQSYDAAGNQLTGHSVNRDLAYVYHYDYHNRLTGVYDSTDTTRKAAFTLDTTGDHVADRGAVRTGRSQSRQGFTWHALGRRIAHTNDALGITTRYFFDGVNELVEYADNGTGNGLRSRYYVHGVSYVDERLMIYDDDTDRPYYYVTDRMHNVRVLVDRAGAIRERYAYDPYGRPLIRELCGRGDMNDDTRMTTTPDDARFAAAKDGSICDPRADLDDDGDVDGDDETAYHNKKPTWSSVMSAPTVSQAFSDFDNPYAFQGVPHFAIDTAANATSEQLNLALNHHRARFADAQTGRWTTRDPLCYNLSIIQIAASGTSLSIPKHIVSIGDGQQMTLSRPSVLKLEGQSPPKWRIHRFSTAVPRLLDIRTSGLATSGIGNHVVNIVLDLKYRDAGDSSSYGSYNNRPSVASDPSGLKPCDPDVSGKINRCHGFKICDGEEVTWEWICGCCKTVDCKCREIRCATAFEGAPDYDCATGEVTEGTGCITITFGECNLGGPGCEEPD
jgi:YD repeat-containing protein